MSKDKLTLALITSTIVVALFDIAYIIFLLAEYLMLAKNTVFVYGGFNVLTVSAIIINGVALIFGILYIFLRRKGTLIK